MWIYMIRQDIILNYLDTDLSVFSLDHIGKP